MRRRVFLFIAMACGGAVAVAERTSPAEPPGAPWFVSIKLCEQAGEAESPKVLAEAVVATRERERFRFQSGGRLAGRARFAVGVRGRGRVFRLDEGAARLEISLRVARQVEQSDDPDTVVVTAEVCDVATSLPLGRTKRIACSPSRWCEVRVEPDPDRQPGTKR